KTQIQQTREPLLNTTTQTQEKQTLQSKTETQAAQQPLQLPSETVRQALKLFQGEADVEQAINLVRKEISSNPNIDLAKINQMEQVLDEAQNYADRGRELKARQHVTNELTQLQETLAKTEPKQAPTQPALDYDVNEMLQSLNLQSKDIIVTKVTQK